MDTLQSPSGSTEELQPLAPGNWRPRMGRAVCSALILACLVTQALVVARVFHPPRVLTRLAPLRRLPAPSLWPFIDYPMFSEAHRVGERVARVVLVIEWELGGEQRFFPEQHVDGLDVEAMIRELRSGQETPAMRRLAAFERQRRAPATRVRVERSWLQLERDGFVAGAPELLLTLRVAGKVTQR